MDETTQQEERLIRNLYDAGCSNEFVEQFMNKDTVKTRLEQLRLLTEHRSKILNNVHEEQSKLDCLDYLLFQINKMSDTH